MEINILILSVGTRNKIVQYFKKEVCNKGKVVVTDASIIAPALYEADKYYIVPKINQENYWDEIIKICTKEKINAVLSLIDPELSILAKNEKQLKEMNIISIVSDYATVEMCFDKYKFLNEVKNNGLNMIKSYIDFDLFLYDYNNGIINFPVFVKPIKGSASININKIDNIEELSIIFKKNNNLMIQEYIEGEEFGVDVYIDFISNKITSLFIKKKIKMRAGETDKSVSIIDDKLSKIIINFVSKYNFRGPIDIDVFKVMDKYYISEINPRFGGGYPHAYECGINFINNIVLNLNGFNSNINLLYKENVYMMKYNEIKIKGE